MLRLIAALPLAVLAGCTGTQGETYLGMPGSPAWFATAAPQTIASYFAQQCSAYGFTLGTPEMAQCIQTEAAQKKQTNAIRSAAVAQANATMAAANQPPRMVTTRCNRFGNSVNCTSF